MKLAIITIVLFLPLSAPVGAFSHDYYFDAVGGNDSTGAPDNINRPFKTLGLLNTILANGTIATGDTVKFNTGTSQYQQLFRGNLDLSTAPPNLTFTSYGSNPYMPVLDGGRIISGWGGGPTVYTLRVVINFPSWLWEDFVPLPVAGSSSCADGNWYYDDGAGTLYYRPTTGVPGNHTVEYFYGYVFYCQHGNGIAISGLGFVGAGIAFAALSGQLTNLTVTNCSFWGGANLLIRTYYSNLANTISITKNSFNNSNWNSIMLATGDNGATSGITNITIAGNTITNNNLLPNGTPWVVRDADVDAIYAQNWGKALVQNNDISGDTGTGYFSSALQVYNALGSNGIVAVGGYANNGSGLFRVYSATALGPDVTTGAYVYIYGAAGNGAPNGKWQITLIDSNHFDLQGSAYAPGCSGGSWYLEIPVNPDYTVCYNFIHDVRSGLHLDSGVGGIGATNHKIKVYYNILARCSRYGINIARIQAPVQSGVYNNTLKDCGTSAICGVDGIPGAALLMNGGDNLAIENNIAAGSCNLFAYDHAASGNNLWDYNCYYNANSGNVFRWGGALQNWSAWRAARDNHSITADPKFVNGGGSYALATDFRLQAGSSAIGAGTNVGLTSDYAGTALPQGSAPDIGAYESINSLPPPSGFRLIQ
jgi:hypothetical protein